MKAQAKILLVEDDEKIARVLLDYLHASDYLASHIADGLQALQRIQSEHFDLILLDRMLPNMDGVQICQEVRKFSAVPIIMLTAMVDEVDKLTGLDSGADDYVCKPFSPREVLARVNAQLRRSGLMQGDNKAPTLVQKKLFEINQECMSIALTGQVLSLTPVEFRLLAEMIRHPGRVYTRQQLLNVASEDFRESGDRTVDSHIKNIRKKISGISPQVDCLQSVYGIGYRFEEGAAITRSL
jgi:two-component system response regulator BaeR